MCIQKKNTNFENNKSCVNIFTQCFFRSCDYASNFQMFKNMYFFVRF